MIGVGSEQFLEFFDTAVLPVVDGGNGYSKGFCCLLVTEPPAHDQSYGCLLVIRQVPEGCGEHPCVDPSDPRVPGDLFSCVAGPDAGPTLLLSRDSAGNKTAGGFERPS